MDNKRYRIAEIFRTGYGKDRIW